MAEFCLDCMNKLLLNGTKKLELSDVLTGIDLCEGCGERKACVISILKSPKRSFRSKKWHRFWK